MMTPERWQQVEEVLQAALDRSPPERASFLDEACAGDEDLKSEAELLIRAHDEAGDFIESPAVAEHARVLLGYGFDVSGGRMVGSYKIIERLGAGGMGEVYLAEDKRLNRLVALKILPAFFATNDMRLRRFQREARAVSALNHPNILTIHEVGEEEEIHFIATEFIDGQTIRDLIAAHDLSLEEILDITAQVAVGLAAAHAAGIVHRDIKPENIMRRADGIVKILDFGIAKLTEQPALDSSNEAATILQTQTETGAVIGTIGYMSPEQARGLAVDERTDIWSLGCVLYEMLARRAPFASATRMDTLVAVLEREPPPVFQSMPFAKDTTAALQSLERIVDKTLRKKTNERYQKTTELLADLEGVRRQLDATSGATSKALTFYSAASIAPRASSDAVSYPQKKARRLLYGHAFISLIVAASLMLAMAGTFLYKRASVRRDADTTNASSVHALSNKLYAQMSDAEQRLFIDEQAQRISAMMGDHRAKLNEEALSAIKRYVDYYAAPPRLNQPGGDDFRVAYARAVPYVPLIAREFAARKVPLIVGVYLPMIESGYRVCFESSMGAKGLFQFLPQTAKHYGVALEEMCDVKKMTPAAAHYIADRMAELGDDAESMTLVLLSYNRGAEAVRSALRQLRTADNYERNFWTLYANRDKLDDEFRNEGAGYVPNFFAAAIIGENPQNFGLQSPPLSTLTGQQVPVIP
ncbi:MAG: serine/threonine-protein kinase [Pyrinomonadaceae bacterium]